MSKKMKMITKEEFCKELGISVFSWLFSMNPDDKHVFWKETRSGVLYYQGFKPNGKERFCNRFKRNLFGTEWKMSYRIGMEDWGKWQSWTYRA